MKFYVNVHTYVHVSNLRNLPIDILNIAKNSPVASVVEAVVLVVSVHGGVDVVQAGGCGCGCGWVVVHVQDVVADLVTPVLRVVHQDVWK